MTQHQSIFTPQYTDFSGPGSTFDFSAPYRHFVEAFLRDHLSTVKTVLDLGCGDGVVASNIDWQGAKYHGYDVIAERVQKNRTLYPHLEFDHADLRTVPLDADLVLCKDVIQHWSTPEVADWVLTLKSVRYALITNCAYDPVNGDIGTGGWRSIDLTKPPFSIGKVVFSWGDRRKDIVLIEGSRA
jgi:SAM-dependent methyltransferase